MNEFRSVEEQSENIAEQRIQDIIWIKETAGEDYVTMNFANYTFHLTLLVC
jgi:hypothetical protein